MVSRALFPVVKLLGSDVGGSARATCSSGWRCITFLASPWLDRASLAQNSHSTDFCTLGPLMSADILGSKEFTVPETGSKE
jgi:hypothetical protein